MFRQKISTADKNNRLCRRKMLVYTSKWFCLFSTSQKEHQKCKIFGAGRKCGGYLHRSLLNPVQHAPKVGTECSESFYMSTCLGKGMLR